MSATQSHADHHTDIDELDSAIVTLAARINASSYELLVLIRRFDERAGWLKWGFTNCTDWLHWRCDLSVSAAREKVRVAHALKTLPAIASAFSSGELSYSKVRALTRVAALDNEDALLAFAQKTTATRVEERCRELRCGTADSVSEANRAYANRSIDKAIDKAREASTSAAPEFAEESWPAQQADALVTMANAYLTGQREASTGTAENYQVTVHVDRTALTDGRGRSGLPIESVRRLCCDGDTVVIVEDEHGEPLNVGRKTRTVPTAIRRALWSRDKGCVFPGCRNKRFVDAHHIQHWSAGGETSLDNLLLLCTRHHRLVHEGGFSIAKDYLDNWYFKRPGGQAVPHCGYRLLDTLDDDIDADGAIHPSAEGLPALLHQSPPWSVAERSPPAYRVH